MSTNEVTIDPKFVLKNYEKGGELENTSVVDIALAMSQAPTDELKYKFAKLLMEKTKNQFVDPMKEVREKEREEESKKAEERQKVLAEYRDRLTELITDDLLEEFATIAADYSEAGHGEQLTIELFAKKDKETGEFTAEFSSNIAKARSRKAGTTRTREAGPTGDGVLVWGKARKVDSCANLAGEYPELTETTFDSFAEAARILEYVNDNTKMKGLNCKRLLESKGFETGYVKSETVTHNPVPAVRIRK